MGSLLQKLRALTAPHRGAAGHNFKRLLCANMPTLDSTTDCRAFLSSAAMPHTMLATITLMMSDALSSRGNSFLYGGLLVHRALLVSETVRPFCHIASARPAHQGA
jgi:hypothetical protein